MQPVAVDVDELAVPRHPRHEQPLEGLRRRVVRLEHRERAELQPDDGQPVEPPVEEVDERLHLR